MKVACPPLSVIGVRTGLRSVASALFPFPVLYCALMIFTLPADAAPPMISDIEPRVLQVASTMTIEVRGANLDGACSLLAPGLAWQRIKQTEDSHAKAVRFEVTLPPDTLPGIYPVWIANANGVSSAASVLVSALPVRPFDSHVSELPVSLHGRLEGGTILQTSFEGQQGEQISLEIISRRLGSNLRPVIRLLNPRGTQVAWDQGNDLLEGDGRCTCELKESGTYSIQVHDLLYRGQGPGFFVLQVGRLETADLVFPLGVQRGTQQTIQVVQGTLTGTADELAVAADDLRHAIPFAPSPSAFGGTPPSVALSSHAEINEQDLSSGSNELPAAPVAVSGMLENQKQRDRFVVPVSPNTRVRFEVFAQRVGSALDGVLVVRRENGAELGRGDDQNGTSDPMVEIQIPGDVNRVLVDVEDLLKRRGPTLVYRLVITDLSRPQFTLAADTDHVTIPAGGAGLVKVTSSRQAYDGTIELACDGLPEGVRVTGGQIPGGGDQAFLVLTADHAVPPSLIRIRGKGVAGDAVWEELALAPDTLRAARRPWLRESLAIGGGSSPSVSVTWDLAEGATLPLGGKLETTLHVARAEGITGKVRVRLLTTQPMPRKKVKENNQEKEVDDVERALRLENDLMLDAAEGDLAASILVPEDLPARAWGLVFAAELLSADGKSVVATNYSACRLVPAAQP